MKPVFAGQTTPPRLARAGHPVVARSSPPEEVVKGREECSKKRDYFLAFDAPSTSLTLRAAGEGDRESVSGQSGTCERGGGDALGGSDWRSFSAFSASASWKV